MRQKTLSDIEYSNSCKRTKWEEFLDLMRLLGASALITHQGKIFAVIEDRLENASNQEGKPGVSWYESLFRR